MSNHVLNLQKPSFKFNLKPKKLRILEPEILMNEESNM